MARRHLNGAQISIIVGLITATSKVATAAWSLLLARLLSPGPYGEFAFVFSIVGVAQIFSDAGVAAYISRTVALRGPNDALDVKRQLARIQGLLSGTVGLGLAFALIVMGSGYSVALAVMANVIIMSLAQVGRGSLRGSFRTHHEALLQVVGTVAIIAATALWAERLTPSVVLWVYLLQNLPLLILTIRELAGVREAERTTTEERPHRALWSLIKKTLPFNILGSAGALFTRLDVLVLGALAASEVVGHYSAALQFYTGFVSIASATVVTLLPVFVQRQNEAGFARLMIVASVVYFFLGVAAFGASVVAGRYSQEIFGPEYRGLSPLITVLAAALPFAFASGAVGQGLLALNRERTVAVNMVGLTLAAAFLYPVLFRHFGSYGVAGGLVVLTATSACIQATVLFKSVRALGS